VFDSISQNVFVESLAIKFLMQIMIPVYIHILAYFDFTYTQQFSFQSYSAISGDLFGLQDNPNHGPTIVLLTMPDGPVATIGT
jgi:hypothetical protein